jgi:uncharacterized protein (DUF1778 family)
MDPIISMSDDSDVKRDVVVRLLVTQAERDAMQAAADKDGQTLSEWIRRRCIRTSTTVAVADAADPLHTMSPEQKKRMLSLLANKPRAKKKGGR